MNLRPLGYESSVAFIAPRARSTCGISLALVHEQTPALGVITLPYLRRRYWAAAGQGAWRDGRPIEASKAASLKDAMVAVGGYTLGRGDEERDQVLRALVPQLAERAQRTRMFGTSAMDLVSAADGGGGRRSHVRQPRL